MSMSNTVSRRSFLRGAGAVAGASALGVMAASALADEAAPEAAAAAKVEDAVFAESRVVVDPIADDQLEATYDYDVVVVGAGTAGTTAAFAAADKGGVKVAVLQNVSTPISQGNMGSGLVIDESTEWGLKRFIHDWNVNTLHASDYFMVENYTKYSGYGVEMLLNLARESGFPEENILVSDDMIEYENGERVCSRRLLFIDKPITWGDAMTSISTIGPDHNVDYYFNMPGVQLVQDDAGKVVAVIGKNEDTGGYVRFNVTKGVILATGSFINNQAMLARYNTQAVGYTAKVSGRLGDGHLMGVLAGGVLPNGIYTKMCHDNDTGPFQSVPLLCVNYDGERFINEEIDSTLWCNATARAKEKGRMFQVVDSTYPQICEALGMKPPTEEKILGCMPGTEQSNAKGAYGFFSATYKADTLEELAEQLGLPAENLIATVERYNELAEAGLDVDFGKDSKYLFPIVEPPFYIVNTWSRLSTILAGLAINEYQQVVDADGAPIEGLYAAGNCSGTPGGQSDWLQVSLGESLGFALNEGYVAGSHIVGALEA